MIDATDRAITLAKRFRLPLDGINGTGTEGRIVVTDVMIAASPYSCFVCGARALMSDQRKRPDGAIRRELECETHGPWVQVEVGA